jgi:lipoate-protein ligase A
VSAATVCRLIIDPEPKSGPWNMAVDEALLTSAVVHGRCTVRIYGWNEATLSLGYFQPAESARQIAEFTSLPIVRRLTGGGAILHHHELTYSVTLPPGHTLANPHEQLYNRVHEQFVAVLWEFGIHSGQRSAVSDQPETATTGRRIGENSADAFLCFGRGDPHDVVFRGHKILGSAQRRRRGAVLQHGSLLLRRSDHAPQHPGLFDLAESQPSRAWTPIEEAILADRLATAVGEVLAQSPGRFSLEDEELRLATDLSATKYSRLDWR